MVVYGAAVALTNTDKVTVNLQWKLPLGLTSLEIRGVYCVTMHIVRRMGGEYQECEVEWP